MENNHMGFLEWVERKCRNQKVAEYQSVVSRRIYNDQNGSEILVCSDSEEEEIDEEEDKKIVKQLGPFDIVYDLLAQLGPFDVKIFDCKSHGCSQELVFSVRLINQIGTILMKKIFLVPHIVVSSDLMVEMTN
ncbi:histone-lysine N-methyltransferase CLF-like isoform X2 [Rutidosis leptorrhynchoides]|uniref:histone-lysine N-methyltransferase CLF-like isoform X2 n=1 Tax=Rutidosis leptorrhynchoides TaxID=125765 RepID=UPI003A98F522